MSYLVWSPTTTHSVALSVLWYLHLWRPCALYCAVMRMILVDMHNPYSYGGLLCVQASMSRRCHPDTADHNIIPIHWRIMIRPKVMSRPGVPSGRFVSPSPRLDCFECFISASIIRGWRLGQVRRWFHYGLGMEDGLIPVWTRDGWLADNEAKASSFAATV
jgi:hypothetical protein